MGRVNRVLLFFVSQPKGEASFESSSNLFDKSEEKKIMCRLKMKIDLIRLKLFYILIFKTKCHR
jgi:hypothetical protein